MDEHIKKIRSLEKSILSNTSLGKRSDFFDIGHIITKEDRIWYESSFSSLTQLYNYLLSNPKVNKRVFNEMSSQKDDYDFSGIPYEDALNCIINSNTQFKDEIKLFLELNRKLASKSKLSNLSTQRKEDIYGFLPNIDAYLKGRPKNMIRLERVRETKFVTIHFNISYPWYTSSTEVLHRGVITLHLINLLEKNNYRVRFNVFSLCKKYREFSFIKINLKKDGENLNINKCYFPLCRKEFLRRIEFRLMESTPFKEIDWGSGYGSNISCDEIRSVLDIPENDIVIGYPRDMDIHGSDVYRDAENFMEVVNLKKYIKVKR